MDLDAVALIGRDNQIGALLTRLVRSAANEQRKPRVRLAIQQFAHQLRSEKAGSAGNKDKLFTVHSDSGLNARTTRRPDSNDL
jgi:hypothetical protein